MVTYETCIDALLDQADPEGEGEGGWGYVVGQPVQLEPTCLAILALAIDRDRNAEAIAAARRALERCAGPDGGYRLNPGRPQATWPTALVLFVQSVLKEPRATIDKTAARLLAWGGKMIDDPKAAEAQDIDLHLVGWPWAEGNFSWAEPTAWACLALRKAGFGDHPRVQEGMRLLLDRTFDEGGINYGNRRIFDRLTEPVPGPTALMLLALQDFEGSSFAAQPRIQASIRYLQKEVLERNDLEDLCWGRLSLRPYQVDLPVERIIAAYEQRPNQPWLRPSPVRTALTALALGIAQAEPFHLLRSPLHLSTQHSALSTPYSPPPSWSERMKSYFRGLVLEGASQLRPPPAQATVHVAPVSDYNADLVKILKEQYAHFRDKVPLAGKRVVLKPNLVEFHRDKVINTDPRVVAAAIDLCQSEGAAEVIVAEGPGHWRNVEFIVAASGLGDVLRHYQTRFVDLNHDEPKKMLNLGRLTRLDYLYMATTAASADVLITLPKLKTHHWAGATLSLKNSFGIMSGICYGWPKNELHWRGIENSIVDISLTRPPDLAIVDGIVGMEGDGPLNGTAKPLGALIMGADPVAVDATCCRLMHLDPAKIGYLALAQRKRLGSFVETTIEQRGESIRRLAQPFATIVQLNHLMSGRSA